jgi:cytochrome c-type biogenesis protein CcmH
VVALGNTLVGHSDGLITPAAQFAFQKAAKISPEHPGPPFFMGLALAQSGKLVEARAIWAELLRRAPADAPIGKTSRPGWRDSI